MGCQLPIAFRGAATLLLIMTTFNILNSEINQLYGIIKYLHKIKNNEVAER